MAAAGAALLCGVLLGLHLCHGIELLQGLAGQSFFFPALRPLSADIVRVIWRTRDTHIAEAKPGAKTFAISQLPELHDRLFIHPANLSLEMRPLRQADGGRYEVTVDTSSDPTNPKSFTYFLVVRGDLPETVTSDTGGHGDTTTQGAGGGAGACGLGGSYCVVKGYLVATLLGLLLLLVAAVHIMPGTKPPRAGVRSQRGQEWGLSPPLFKEHPHGSDEPLPQFPEDASSRSPSRLRGDTSARHKRPPQNAATPLPPRGHRSHGGALAAPSGTETRRGTARPPQGHLCERVGAPGPKSGARR